MRRLLMHPTAGKFRSRGSIEWPDDQYTRKRLADGSVKLANQPAPAEQPEEAKPASPRLSRARDTVEQQKRDTEKKQQE
jgi:hypothetical protein